MHVIIAGGTGIIGRALTDILLANQYQVTILSRNPAKATDFPAGVRVEQWDAKTVDGWGRLVDETDAIVNLAGENLAGTGPIPARWTKARKQRFIDSRINAGQAVTAAIQAAENKPKVLIQASAVGYYGTDAKGPLTEDSPPGDDFQAKLCVTWENSVAPVAEMGVRVVSIRTGVVLSMDGGAFPPIVFPFKVMQAGGPLGDGKQGFPWIHVTDEAQAIRFLMENAQAVGPFNLNAPNPPTNAEFTRAVGRVMHRPAFLPVPAFVLKLAFGEAATLVLDGWKPVPKRLQDLGFTFQFPDAKAAVRDLLDK